MARHVVGGSAPFHQPNNCSPPASRPQGHREAHPQESAAPNPTLGNRASGKEMPGGWEWSDCHRDHLVSGRQNYSMDPTSSIFCGHPVAPQETTERKTLRSKWGGPRMAPKHSPSTKPWKLPLRIDNAATWIALLEGMGLPDSPFQQCWGTGFFPLSRVTWKEYSTGVKTCVF